MAAEPPGMMIAEGVDALIVKSETAGREALPLIV